MDSVKIDPVKIKSIRENDPDKLADNIDFEKLRQNIKDHLNFKMVKSTTENIEEILSEVSYKNCIPAYLNMAD